MRIGLFSGMERCQACKLLADEYRSHGNEAYVVALDLDAREKTWSVDKTMLLLPPQGMSVSLREIQDLSLDVILCFAQEGIGEFADICADELGIPMVYSCAEDLGLHFSWAWKDYVMALIAEDESAAHAMQASHILRSLEIIPFPSAWCESVNPALEAGKAIENTGSTSNLSMAYAEKAMDVLQRAVSDYASRAEIESIVPKGSYLLTSVSMPGKEACSIKVSVDDFASMKLKKGRKLVPQEVDFLIGRESGIGAYEKCLRRISYHDRSEKEVREWLCKDCEPDVADKILARLKHEGYVDDERYCRSRVEAMVKELWGKKQIVHRLMEKGLPRNLIERMLEETGQDSYGNARKVCEKMLRGHGSGSLRKTQEKIRRKLVCKGYDSEEIEHAINTLDYGEDLQWERANLRKCVEKARKRLGRKLSGSALRNKVYQYCMQQGYGTEDIKEVLEEMMDNEED